MVELNPTAQRILASRRAGIALTREQAIARGNLPREQQRELRRRIQAMNIRRVRERRAKQRVIRRREIEKAKELKQEFRKQRRARALQKVKLRKAGVLRDRRIVKRTSVRVPLKAGVAAKVNLRKQRISLLAKRVRDAQKQLKKGFSRREAAKGFAVVGKDPFEKRAARLAQAKANLEAQRLFNKRGFVKKRELETIFKREFNKSLGKLGKTRRFTKAFARQAIAAAAFRKAALRFPKAGKVAGVGAGASFGVDVVSGRALKRAKADPFGAAGGAAGLVVGGVRLKDFKRFKGKKGRRFKVVERKFTVKGKKVGTRKARTPSLKIREVVFDEGLTRAEIVGRFEKRTFKRVRGKKKSTLKVLKRRQSIKEHPVSSKKGTLVRKLTVRTQIQEGKKKLETGRANVFLSKNKAIGFFRPDPRFRRGAKPRERRVVSLSKKQVSELLRLQKRKAVPAGITTPRSKVRAKVKRRSTVAAGLVEKRGRDKPVILGARTRKIGATIITPKRRLVLFKFKGAGFLGLKKKQKFRFKGGTALVESVGKKSLLIKTTSGDIVAKVPKLKQKQLKTLLKQIRSSAISRSRSGKPTRTIVKRKGKRVLRTRVAKPVKRKKRLPLSVRSVSVRGLTASLAKEKKLIKSALKTNISPKTKQRLRNALKTTVKQQNKLNTRLKNLQKARARTRTKQKTRVITKTALKTATKQVQKQKQKIRQLTNLRTRTRTVSRSAQLNRLRRFLRSPKGRAFLLRRKFIKKKKKKKGKKTIFVGGSQAPNVLGSRLLLKKKVAFFTGLEGIRPVTITQEIKKEIRRRIRRR